MKTECTYQVAGFRFTITGRSELGLSIEIENTLPWGETIKAYGHLQRGEMEYLGSVGATQPIRVFWTLKGMTFEDAHDECVLANFFMELYKVKDEAYPEAVKYYEANRQPDIFEIADKILANRKAI